MKNYIRLLLLYIVIFLSIHTNAQDTGKEKETKFIIYPSTATYPGDEVNLMKFISDNLRYPNQHANVQGRVVVRFMIRQDGAVDSVNVMRGRHPDYDKEVIRVVSNMPNWKPAKLGDKTVDSWYTIPLIFKLPEEKKLDIETTVNDSIYMVPDVMPQFPDGEEAMMRFISNNLRHPIMDQCEYGIQGRVTIRFVVTKTGNIEQIKIIRGISPSVDKAAIEVIEKMPKWIPAKHKGELVNAYFLIPVSFRLR